MKDLIQNLFEKQREFQRMVGAPIDSTLEKERHQLAEMYLFKAVEEIIEMRRTFPSVMNPWAKSQPEVNCNHTLEEYCDILLFMVNEALAWGFSKEEIMEQLQFTQANNFKKIKEKKMALLNDEILRVPGKVSGIGSGTLFPRYIFIGQNPGQSIEPGYRFWSNPDDGSSKILLPIIDQLGIGEESYFTNLVKSTTPNNAAPDGTLIRFWMEFLGRELEILQWGISEITIVSMGSTVRKILATNVVEELVSANKKFHYKHIKHPAVVFHGSLSKEDYTREVSDALAN